MEDAVAIENAAASCIQKRCLCVQKSKQIVGVEYIGQMYQWADALPKMIHLPRCNEMNFLFFVLVSDVRGHLNVICFEKNPR